ncbi:Uncharacterised protein [Salmonella enterica subsp. enterica]|uniref:Uncharacterized protein n=1 Tax=Salmonella enterica I TaxID=59201 RepID=A0A447PY47_SALET|nr:Uncharacterised protein [Salmonella enterica subsp. enterica]
MLRRNDLNFAVNRVSDVLLNGMDESIHDAVRNLARRQCIGVDRIQHGKHRLHERGVEGLFVAQWFYGK